MNKHLRRVDMFKTLSPVPFRGFGWLSPGGDFYVCEGGCHETTAWLLCKQLYSLDAEQGGVFLEDEGWVHVGMCGYEIGNREPTVKQLEAVMGRCLAVGDNLPLWAVSALKAQETSVL